MGPEHSCEIPVIGGYVKLCREGELLRRANAVREMLACCTMCPRECRVDRSAGQAGSCGIAGNALVSSYGQHYGEESVLVGRYGSGAIFFAGCNLKCIFCQNYDISQELQGHEVSARELADMMLELQSVGCHNINLVTPTHVIAQILEAVDLAARDGLRVPLVYNSSGYDSVSVLKTLDGIIDIYMPDIKYGDNEPGRLYSGVPDYWDRCREAVREMHAQVGDLDVRTVACDEGGTATVAARGLMVRHLVLPDGLSHTPEVMTFIAEQISRNTYINIMAQYHPYYRAQVHPELSRTITTEEYVLALQTARSAGLHRFAD